MKKPVGYILDGDFHKEKEDFSMSLGQPEPQPVYSHKQVRDLFDVLIKNKEIPFRHTKIVDWDVIKDEFEKFGMTE